MTGRIYRFDEGGGLPVRLGFAVVPAKKKAEVSFDRSSAAEYLTRVAASRQGGVEAVYGRENVWLNPPAKQEKIS